MTRRRSSIWLALRAASGCVISLFLGNGPTFGAGIVHAPDAHSVVLYHLDESVPDQFGTADFEDSSGQGHHATGATISSNGIVMGTAGVTGGADKAVTLKASVEDRNAIRVGPVLPDFTGGCFTLEAWLRNPSELASAEGNLGRLIAVMRKSIIAWSLGINAAGGFRLFSTQTGKGFSYSHTPRGWAPDTWYYVALVSDTNGQASGKARYSFYRRPLGGPLSCLGSFVTNAIVNSVDTDDLTFGDDLATSMTTRMFIGQMDEIHFSNTARSIAYLEASSTRATTQESFRFHQPDAASLILWHADDTVAYNSETYPDLEDSSFNDLPGRAYRDGLDLTPQTVFLNAAGVDGTTGGGVQFIRGSQDLATIIALRPVPTNVWNGGDFTVELWVKGIGDDDLVGTDEYGCTLVGTERLLGAEPANGAGWGLVLDSAGQFRVGSDTNRTTIANDLAWDSNVWYYIALTVEADGAGAGQSLFTVYRGALGPQALQKIGTVNLPNVGVKTAGDKLTVGCFQSDRDFRKLDFTFDELHYSGELRPFAYLDYHFRGPPCGTILIIE